MAACVGMAMGGGEVALAQGPAGGAEVAEVGRGAATEVDGARHRVSRFVFRYSRENAGHPGEEALLDAKVRLGVTEAGWVAPREGIGAESVALREMVEGGRPGYVFDSALPLLAPGVVRRLQELGLIGVFVEPDPAEFAVVEGRIVDKRPETQRQMTLVITTGEVTQVRTSALGERLKENEEAVDNPVHARIRANSPVQAREADKSNAEDERTDLVRRDLIDAYVHRLNRHPGRRVDVALAPSGEAFGGVTLDYLVTENRPWLLFAQASNTGTDATNTWRERIGFVHNQLTGNDDIFSVDYLTGNFEDVHAVAASYERPFGSGEIGERLRWRISGSWYTYTASDVGLPGADFDGEGWNVGGELRWNFFQREDLFVDLVGGARFERVQVDNSLAGIEGDEPFFLPFVGLRLERVRESEQTYAGVSVEWNAAGLAGTDSEEVDRLGRLDTDDSWVTLQWNGSHSFYLEPLLASGRKATSLAHEVSLSGNGQFSFGSRLAPNYEQTVGGLYSVRGYPESVASGDTAVTGTLEYRFHVPQGLTPRTKTGEVFGTPFRFAPQYVSGPTDWDLIFKAFVDIGRVENSDRQSFERDHTLVGMGVGAELSLTRRLNVRIDWGFALRGIEDAGGASLVDSGDSEVRVVFTLVY